MYINSLFVHEEECKIEGKVLFKYMYRKRNQNILINKSVEYISISLSIYVHT